MIGIPPYFLTAKNAKEFTQEDAKKPANFGNPLGTLH